MPTQIKVGEFARYLASYLEDHVDEFVDVTYLYKEPYIEEKSLAKLIQTFQDTLC